ncbi:MAG: hypothetical protein HY961_00685, partial [Ignavibacteriae bacterium]|nr:hypothetical protein [Ignavibacteriota bacterium]
MKSSTKVLLYIAPLLFAASALSQVDVTATGGTANASYATLKEAFDAINAGTHTDVITIGISGNTTETATAALNASGSGSASYTSISITPTGGATRTITGGIAEGSPLIDFNGADNVTIDGLSSSGNALTIANTTVAATSGTSTIRFINDATNNVITNCSIQGSATMGTTTNGGVMFFSTAASGGNGNDNNTISDCSIGPAGVNLPSKGIYGSGSTTTTAANNSSITISGNRIFDFFSPSTSNAGIYVTSGNTDWSISNNKFYQTGTRTWTTGSSHRVIEISNTSGNNFQVTNNTIGFSSAAGTGTYTLTGSTNTFRAISLNVGTTTASSVQGNTITAISHTTTTSGTTSSSPCMMIFVSSSGLVNIGNSAGNTIGSQDGSTNISFTSSSTSTSDVYGIHNFSLSSTNISSNSIGSITVSNSSTGSVVFFGIRVNTSSTAGITSTILNNVVGNSVGVITNNAAGSFSSRLIGIQNDRAQPTITGNTVRNMIISAPNTNSGTSAAVLGIYNAATANGGVTISHNVIHSL